MFQSRNKSYAKKLQSILWPKKGFQRSFYYLRERIVRMSASTHALSLGVACGAAASMTPFIGLHFVIAAVLAYLVRGNLFASAIGTLIGNPWSFPLIWAADNYVGEWVINQFNLDLLLASMGATTGTELPMAFFFKISLGGVVLAVLSFPLYYGLSYWGLSSWRAHRARKKWLKDQAAKARQEPVAPIVQTAYATSEPNSQDARIDTPRQHNVAQDDDFLPPHDKAS